MTASLAAFLFWISVAVCAVAELAIVAATARASRRATVAADVPQVDGARPLPATRRWLEVLYAVVPAVVLAVLFVFTWRAMHPAPIGDQPSATIRSVPGMVAGLVPSR